MEPTSQAAADTEEKTERENNEGSGLGIWWLVGVLLVAGIGIGGFLISSRRKQQS